MRTVPRNIPINFHRSNIKTERKVCKNLKSGPKCFLAKIRPKKQKFKIPLQRPRADSAKEHSYEVSGKHIDQEEGLLDKKHEILKD